MPSNKLGNVLAGFERTISANNEAGVTSGMYLSANLNKASKKMSGITMSRGGAIARTNSKRNVIDDEVARERRRRPLDLPHKPKTKEGSIETASTAQSGSTLESLESRSRKAMSMSSHHGRSTHLRGSLHDIRAAHSNRSLRASPTDDVSMGSQSFAAGEGFDFSENEFEADFDQSSFCESLTQMSLNSENGHKVVEFGEFDNSFTSLGDESALRSGKERMQDFNASFTNMNGRSDGKKSDGDRRKRPPRTASTRDKPKERRDHRDRPDRDRHDRDRHDRDRHDRDRKERSDRPERRERDRPERRPQHLDDSDRSHRRKPTRSRSGENMPDGSMRRSTRGAPPRKSSLLGGGDDRSDDEDILKSASRKPRDGERGNGTHGKHKQYRSKYRDQYGATGVVEHENIASVNSVRGMFDKQSGENDLMRVSRSRPKSGAPPLRRDASSGAPPLRRETSRARGSASSKRGNGSLAPALSSRSMASTVSDEDDQSVNSLRLAPSKKDRESTRPRRTKKHSSDDESARESEDETDLVPVKQPQLRQADRNRKSAGRRRRKKTQCADNVSDGSAGDTSCDEVDDSADEGVKNFSNKYF